MSHVAQEFNNVKGVVSQLQTSATNTDTIVNRIITDVTQIQASISATESNIIQLQTEINSISPVSSVSRVLPLGCSETLLEQIENIKQFQQSSTDELKGKVQLIENQVSQQSLEKHQQELRQFKQEVESRQLVLNSIQTQLDVFDNNMKEQQRIVQLLGDNMCKLKADVVYKDQIEVADTVTTELDEKIIQLKVTFQSEMNEKVKSLRDEVQSLVDRHVVQMGNAQKQTYTDVKTQQQEIEYKFNSEVELYKNQIQLLSSHLQELKMQNNNEIDSIKKQYNIDNCQQEIQRVESRLVNLLSEFDLANRERSTLASDVSVIKAGQLSIMDQFPPIQQDILEIGKKIDSINGEFNDREVVQDTRLTQIESKIKEYVSANEQMLRQGMDISEACRILDSEYKAMSETFKSQYDTLQKRFQQLHTIMVSNMEETERGNQNVRELVELHSKIEKEYKDMTRTYDDQQKEYNTTLAERDKRLHLLESKVKSQLDNMDSKLTSLQEGEDVSFKQTHSVRIEELAQPRHITPKKVT